ncbi:MAG TPA: GtrA family protein [Burkholderiaceae bacterium]|nr:GtrA family protein [Burkholderiaceae bacterium]
MLDFRLARFLAVGLANTVFGLSAIFACKGLLGLGDVESNLIGYGVGILLGFAVNKRWTFGHTGAAASAFVRYLLVLAVAYAANLATTLFAIDVLRLDSYLAQALGVIPYALTGYIGSRWFAFRVVMPDSKSLPRT